MVKNVLVVIVFVLAVIVSTILVYAGLAVILIIVLASPFWFVFAILAYRAELKDRTHPKD